MARDLGKTGYAVTGVDFSEVQIGRARSLVPKGTFILGDATVVELPPRSFDAVVCLYGLIHMPLHEQPRLLERIAAWLRPGGWLLVTTGKGAWTGTEERWLGGTVPMWWSHADVASYRSWIVRAGMTIEAEEFVPEDSGGHALFWARRD